MSASDRRRRRRVKPTDEWEREKPLPGSNPGPATLIFPLFAGETTTIKRSHSQPLGSVDATWQQPTLIQYEKFATLRGSTDQYV